MIRIALLACAAALALAVGPDWVPEPRAQSEVPQQAAPAYSEQELKTFAVASLEVERISQAYQSKIKAAEDPAQQRELASQATDEMLQAVEKKGLTVDKYNQMVVTVKKDPNLARQVLDYRKEVQ